MSDKPDIIAHTKEVFGKLYGSPVSDDDAKEIIKNVSDFLQLLGKWERETKTEQAEEKQPA
jgi:hypothetical protein